MDGVIKKVHNFLFFFRRLVVTLTQCYFASVMQFLYNSCMFSCTTQFSCVCLVLFYIISNRLGLVVIKHVVELHVTIGVWPFPRNRTLARSDNWTEEKPRL